MARRKNSEGVVLQTKWHGGQSNNDAHKLKEMGFVSPDVSQSYAMAYHKRTRESIFFASQKRYESWIRKQTDIHEYDTVILSNAN